MEDDILQVLSFYSWAKAVVGNTEILVQSIVVSFPTWSIWLEHFSVKVTEEHSRELGGTLQMMKSIS